MDLALLFEKSILILILTAITLGIATYLTYGERKVAAFLQDRLGPNRAGIYGILQPLADAGKMFFKEELIPRSSEKWLFIIGPGLAMITACITSAVIPWGKHLRLQCPLCIKFQYPHRQPAIQFCDRTAQDDCPRE